MYKAYETDETIAICTDLAMFAADRSPMITSSLFHYYILMLHCSLHRRFNLFPNNPVLNPNIITANSLIRHCHTFTGRLQRRYRLLVQHR